MDRLDHAVTVVISHLTKSHAMFVDGDGPANCLRLVVVAAVVVLLNDDLVRHYRCRNPVRQNELSLDPNRDSTGGILSLVNEACLSLTVIDPVGQDARIHVVVKDLAEVFLCDRAHGYLIAMATSEMLNAWPEIRFFSLFWVNIGIQL